MYQGGGVAGDRLFLVQVLKPRQYYYPQEVSGKLLAALVFTVTLGGLKRLAHVSQRLVPAMAVLYVTGGLVILLVNAARIPAVIREIFAGALGLRAAAGGGLGTMVFQTHSRLFNSFLLFLHTAGKCGILATKEKSL